MGSEATAEEFHEVSDKEADEIVEACKHAIPHNEWVGRVIRNVYGRLQSLEKEVADLKKKPKRGGP